MVIFGHETFYKKKVSILHLKMIQAWNRASTLSLVRPVNHSSQRIALPGLRPSPQPKQEMHVSSFLSQAAVTAVPTNDYSWMKRTAVTTEKPSSSMPTLGRRSRGELSSWGRISRKVM